MNYHQHDSHFNHRHHHSSHHQMNLQYDRLYVDGRCYGWSQAQGRVLEQVKNRLREGFWNRWKYHHVGARQRE